MGEVIPITAARRNPFDRKIIARITDREEGCQTIQLVCGHEVYTLGFTSLELNAAVNKKMRDKGRFTNRVFLEQSWEPKEDTR